MNRDDVVDALVALARASVEPDLNDEQLARVRGMIEGKIKQSDELRAVQLANGDEPGGLFRVQRRED